MKDLIIIGAGPVGIYCSILARLHGLDCSTLELKQQTGGQVTAFYQDKSIIDIPGFNNITGKDLIKNLLSQLSSIDVTYKITPNVKVKSVKQQENYFLVETNSGEITGKTVVLSCGRGSLTPIKADFPIDYMSDNIFYNIQESNCVMDDITILGGGDSAVDWANHLAKDGKIVNIIHRRKEFRASDLNINCLKSNGVNIFTPYIVSNLTHNDKKLCLTLKNVENDSINHLVTSSLFINFGFKNSLIEAPCSILQNRYIINSFGETDVKGLFACGDCCYYEGKIDNLTIGFSEANKVIKKVDNLIHPNKTIKLHF